MSKRKRLFPYAFWLVIIFLLVPYASATESTDLLEYANIPFIADQPFTGDPITPSIAVEYCGKTL